MGLFIYYVSLKIPKVTILSAYMFVEFYILDLITAFYSFKIPIRQGLLYTFNNEKLTSTKLHRQKVEWPELCPRFLWLGKLYFSAEEDSRDLVEENLEGGWPGTGSHRLWCGHGTGQSLWVGLEGRMRWYSKSALIQKELLLHLVFLHKPSFRCSANACFSKT